MSQNMILLPVLAQVALTFAVLVIMGRSRGRSMRTRGQSFQDVALATEKDWDAPATQAANNYKNQFEMPVLFYVVTAFALMTRYVDPVLFSLACLFVATRIAHTVIHVGANNVTARGTAFLAGVVALLAMWIVLGWRIAAAGF